MSKSLLANGSELDKIIPPEIAEDAFYAYLVQLCQESSVQTILEIGSSAGQGSTKAFVSGIQASIHSTNKQLFCIEVSRVRFETLQKFYQDESFVKCYNCSSVPISDFPTRRELAQFYNAFTTGLNAYSLDEVFRWLDQDIEYVKRQSVPETGIRNIKQEHNIAFFDLVLIDGSEFTGEAELDEVYGARYICLDDINTYKNHENHNRLCEDKNYELVIEDRSTRNGFSIFKRIGDAPNINNNISVHFLTIVLNGQPFISYHLENVFKQLTFNWHWHIVEGVADLTHDTAWSLDGGGSIDSSIHKNGLSSDGTTEYLDSIIQQFPNNISLYRKEGGAFWDGKQEMVNAPLQNINEECLLWQIDVDELWTPRQITQGRNLFIEYPHKMAAFYWCQYFVGPDLVVSSRNCYSQNPNQEWLRTWRYKPGMRWAAHEPPILVEETEDGTAKKNIAREFPFSHKQTEAKGLVFQHFAYVLSHQLAFKEKYYGYNNAGSLWKSLITQTRFPVFLRDYFDWVNDNTIAEKASSLGIQPIFIPDPQSERLGYFASFNESQNSSSQIKLTATPHAPVVVIDGVFFQLLNSGIGRVWHMLLQEWSQSDFGQHILVLDRNNTAPKVPGIRYRAVPAYVPSAPGRDSLMLQTVCAEENAAMFLSTFYTTPTTTPSVMLIYDMIPEVMNADIKDWQEKVNALMHASEYLAISENTARDFQTFYPSLSNKPITVAHCGVSETFKPANEKQVRDFKEKYNINKPFFCTVGERLGFNGYKNVDLFFKAFALLENKSDYMIVCIGGKDALEPELASIVNGLDVSVLRISDSELASAYTSAAALVYPSKYEGFGMPIAEAMACGCPVITSKTSSIPEVAGDAAIYLENLDIDNMLSALEKIQLDEVREFSGSQGLIQASKFSWQQMADMSSSSILRAIKNKNDNFFERSWLWNELRSMQQQIEGTEGVANFLYSPNNSLNTDIKAEGKTTTTSSTSLDVKTKQRLEDVIEEINLLETSRRWRLRNKLITLKQVIIKSEQPNFVIDTSKSVEIQIKQAEDKLRWMKTSKFLND
ncbi:glycosyltransferase family 4 protein [Leptothoe kymatousa]|uniref:Glycosyltransferase n=1 Tax=Leptothoe kymatousa TAU-MAC 1615 TaxID=2364775 RepID=A0ABS5Y677_9CYAN|nr:glycosyltransferase family 1 protein [Leptothoe kymatousa]MBT9313003.1 glycosyltransferase [Leptothoe kymatousa TAU-MAC 1615]